MTQMVYLDKPLTIQGGYTTSNWITPEPAVNLTILDAQGQGRVFYVSLEGFPTIAGLRITGGNATNQGRGDAGGGIYAEINVQIAPPASLIADNTIYGNTGLGIMEMSHRSKAFEAILASAIDRLRRILGVPKDYTILFIQGGASFQFYMTALNLLCPGEAADFLVTGDIDGDRDIDLLMLSLIHI